MHQVQSEIGVPRIKKDQIADNHMMFVMSPLPTGYGVTLGNSLRRILLSSLPGACVTGVKIAGVTHEYTTIKGVKESVLDLTLNLKLLNIKKTTPERSVIKLKTSKAGEILAKDISCPADVEILNPDQYICTLEKGTTLDMELRIEKGVGYIPARSRQDEEQDAEIILLDANYAPIKKVRYEVENTRIAQMTNLDKLTLEIETDGSILPEDALKFASNLAKSYFSLFNEEEIMVEKEYMADMKSILEKEQEEESKKPTQEAYTPVEILGFSPRTLNALINGGIGSIEQLSKCTESKLANLRGFGKKALAEVASALEKRDLSLADE